MSNRMQILTYKHKTPVILEANSSIIIRNETPVSDHDTQTHICRKTEVSLYLNNCEVLQRSGGRRRLSIWKQTHAPNNSLA